MHNNPKKSWFFHVEKSENDEFSLRCKGISNLKILIVVTLFAVSLFVSQFPELKKVFALLLGGE